MCGYNASVFRSTVVACFWHSIKQHDSMYMYSLETSCVKGAGPIFLQNLFFLSLKLSVFINLMKDPILFRLSTGPLV